MKDANDTDAPAMTDDPQRLLEESRQEEAIVLMTAKEYADLFRCSPRSVHYAVKAGTIPFPVIRPTGRVIQIQVPACLVRKLRAA